MQVEPLYAQNFEELFRIHQKEYNIGLLNIEDMEPTLIKPYLESVFEKIPKMFKTIIDKNSFDESIKQLDEIYYILDECYEKEMLISYIKTLTSHFADVTDSPLMGVSLEKVEGDLCKYYHCDMNHLRLVYPLLGSGTLWLHEDNINREHLGKGQNELVIKDQSQIKQVPAKTISILKGQGHPTALKKAVVHASPPLSAKPEKRILLRIESLF